MREIVVVGAGPLGLLGSLLLARSGARVTLLDPDPRTPRPWLGVAWPSPNDPPTRAVVAHGEEVARWLVDIHRQGLSLLGEGPFCETFSVDEAQAFRYGLEAFEREELLKAATPGYGGAGSTEGPVPAPGLGLEAQREAVGLQAPGPLFRESARALVEAEPEAWRAKAHAAGSAAGLETLITEVSALEETTGGVHLSLRDGRTIDAELVLLAASWSIGRLLPAYEKVLVPMTDACFLWRREGAATRSRAGSGVDSGVDSDVDSPAAASPVVLRGNSGHVAVAWHPDSPVPLRIAGPRFLWPDAGVGVARAGPVEPGLIARALAFHDAKTLPLLARMLEYGSSDEFLRVERLAFASASFGVDCLPCDELPVAGELGRWGRVLGAAGFLGAGFSAHAAVARALVDIAWSGRSDRLHPRASPRRLDSI